MQAKIPQGLGRVAITKLVFMAPSIRKVKSMVIDKLMDDISASGSAGHHYQITKKTVTGNFLKNSHIRKGQITYSRTKITTIKDFRSEIYKPENTE